MPFHNNRLREISLNSDFEEKPAVPTPPRDMPRAGAGRHAGRQAEPVKNSVKREETPEKKRKRDETAKFQALHDQPAVDAARGADMDQIHFSEPFGGLNYTSTNTYMCNEHLYANAADVTHPSARYYGSLDGDAFHGFENGSSFYNLSAPNAALTRSLSGDTLVASSFVPSSFASGHLYDSDDANEGLVDITQEDSQDNFTVSALPAEDSEFAASESEEERPRKAPKINKDGALRKPRQPRAKLLKWSDDDWKNVCLGIVWACGETGLQIPFDQAAQVVGEKCTAGALQQALLKLRGKQIAEGHQIPNLKMAWTRKAGYAPSSNSSQESEANKPRKKPTRMEATQTLLVTLPRAYNAEEREGMACPYKWKKPPRKMRTNMQRGAVEVKHEGSADGSTSFPSFINDPPQRHDNITFSYEQPEMAQTSQPSLLTSLFQTHRRGNVARGSGTLTPNPAADIQGDAAVYDYANNDTQGLSPAVQWYGESVFTPSQELPDYVPATPTTSRNFYNSPPATPFGNDTGYLQGMEIGTGEYASLLSAEGLHEFGNGFADATDDVFSA